MSGAATFPGVLAAGSRQCSASPGSGVVQLCGGRRGISVQLHTGDVSPASRADVELPFSTRAVFTCAIIIIMILLPINRADNTSLHTLTQWAAVACEHVTHTVKLGLKPQYCLSAASSKVPNTVV